MQKGKASGGLRPLSTNRDEKNKNALTDKKQQSTLH